jgi:hypothetical protein
VDYLARLVRKTMHLGRGLVAEHRTRTGSQHCSPKACLPRRHPAEGRVSPPLQPLPIPGLGPPRDSVPGKPMIKNLRTTDNPCLKIKQLRQAKRPWICHGSSFRGRSHDRQSSFATCG